MEVRRILEEFSAEISRRSPLLTEAYGKMLFKCPIISCAGFYRGFENPEQRDKHLGQHERAHKCTHEGCDYRELGFPTEVELRRHVELCHNALPEEPTFPNVQRVNLSKALNDAIDRDDVQAVRDICSEVLVCPLRQTGFVLRAMKRRSISTALVLVELLGTDVEMNHMDTKGRTVLHEAVQIRNDDLFDRILDTAIDVEVRDRDGYTPFLRALLQGYFHAIRLFMNHAGVNIIPQNNSLYFGIYYQSMKEAAAGGVDDVLKALFSHFVSLFKSNPKSYLEKSVSDTLTRIIAKAATNRHESSVKLILELAHDLELESRYHGLLNKELHHGIEAMTTFLMQRYGEAKQEIGKNGKTYGNALAHAALKDDSGLIMRLLKDGADIDYADGGLAYNALGAAASRGNLPMVTLLVEQGADINAKGGYFGTALGLACCEEHMDIITFLLKRGADINLQGRSLKTALMECCQVGNYSLVRFLIEAGADVTLSSRSQNTALHSACCVSPKSSNRGDIVDILIQKGADVNLQNNFKETALYEASENGHQEIVEILVRKGSDINLQNRDGKTALYRASEIGYKEIVEILVRKGADVNLQNEWKETALYKASERGHKDIVKILVQMGANVNLQDKYEETALYKASERGHKDIVKILVQMGANVNLQDKYEETALFAAFRKGNREVVQVLIEAEIDLEAKGSKQRTALLQAAGRGWVDIVLTLIEKGADVGSVDADQRTALLIASEKGHMEVVQILMQEGADVNLRNRPEESALFVAFERGNRERVQALIQAEVDITVKDSHQRTALLQAAERGWVDVVQILIDKGADIDSVDADQQTALLKASGKGHVDVVRILLASGAKGLEAALTTAFMNRPADVLELLLKQASRSQQRTAVQMFLQDVDVAGVYTPGGVYDYALSFVCSFGSEESIEILLEEGAKFYDAV